MNIIIADGQHSYEFEYDPDMFDPLTIRDALPILWLKRAFTVIIVAFLAIGMVSAHRAYFQVRDSS